MRQGGSGNYELWYAACVQINLNVPVDRVALSNMNVVATEPTESGQRQLVKFATTPIMSTYLVAFVVGELDHIETASASGIQVRVYTPPGLSEQGRFALDVAAATLDFFATYFGEPYPLPKMDLVAVPDFAAGAMENWCAPASRPASLAAVRASS